MMPYSRHKPIKPWGKSIREPLWQRLLKWLGTAIFMLIFGMAMAVITIEWFAGCGESYVDANGVRHLNECVFIPFPR